MGEHPISQKGLMRGGIIRFVGAALVLGLMFFWPAGRLDYWQAWIYMLILFIPVFLVMLYMLKYEPDLMARRMQMKEKVPTQNKIVMLSYIPFLAAFLLPGFDIRYGWSNVPAWLVIAADVLVVAGYGVVFLVFRENRYASRIIEVAQGQTVISSGPYAVVRHPMYSGVVVLYCISPLALGSYWGMIPALLVIPTLVARILNEESILAVELKGYKEYMQKVRYRLLPGIW